MLGIEQHVDPLDPRRSSYVSFCIDEAVAWLGNEISAVLSSVDGKTQKEVDAKQRLVLRRLFAEKKEQRFRSVTELKYAGKNMNRPMDPEED